VITLPRELSDLQLSFGVCEGYLPEDEELTLEALKPCAWAKPIIDAWYFEGLPLDTLFKPRLGIEGTQALRHIAACLHSWEPRHERKIEGCIYLLHLWFEHVIVSGKIYQP
jgi:hypothetical protein